MTPFIRFCATSLCATQKSVLRHVQLKMDVTNRRSEKTCQQVNLVSSTNPGAKNILGLFNHRSNFYTSSYMIINLSRKTKFWTSPQKMSSEKTKVSQLFSWCNNSVYTLQIRFSPKFGLLSYIIHNSEIYILFQQYWHNLIWTKTKRN